MKIITLATILIGFIVASTGNPKTNTTENETIISYESPYYYVLDHYWYTVAPTDYVYVSSLSNTYDYFYNTYEPVYDIYFRKDTQGTESKSRNENKEETYTLSKEEMKHELHNLKTEILGDENASLASFRRQKKSYDTKWLLAQYRISRVLFLEDQLSKALDEKGAQLHDINNGIKQANHGNDRVESNVQSENVFDSIKNSFRKGIMKGRKMWDNWMNSFNKNKEEKKKNEGKDESKEEKAKEEDDRGSIKKK